MTGMVKGTGPGVNVQGACSGCVTSGKWLYLSKPRLILLSHKDSFIHLTNINQMAAICQAPF